MDLKCVANIQCDQGAVRAIRFNGKAYNVLKVFLCFDYCFFICFIVDGEYCLTCGSNKKIKLWNPYKELCLKTYAGHGDSVMDVCSSCDSRYFFLNVFIQLNVDYLLMIF